MTLHHQSILFTFINIDIVQQSMYSTLKLKDVDPKNKNGVKVMVVARPYFAQIIFPFIPVNLPPLMSPQDDKTSN
jgi:hypothetical protein